MLFMAKAPNRQDDPGIVIYTEISQQNLPTENGDWKWQSRAR